MTLLELSKEYRTQAGVLRGRMTQLRRIRPVREQDRLALEGRMRTLETLWREARDLAVLTERYYDRGYRRNAKYTL